MSFTFALIDRLQRAALDEYAHNWDAQRFGRERWTRKLFTWARRAAKSLGFGPYRWVNRVRAESLERWKDELPHMEWMYHRLADDESRRWLVDTIAYRWMGPRAVKLRSNTPEYWAQLKQLAELRIPGHALEFGFNDWRLERFDLTSIGYPFALNTRAANVLAQFELEQYACPRIGVRAGPGDVVIDGGGCFGDTAMYFSHRVGASGRVYSLEFVESNLRLFRHNLALNPDQASRIEICPHPLWSVSDAKLFVIDRGPASSVLSEPPAGQAATPVETISIDELVRRRGLSRVDLIKMDIEGAEYEALRGAERTIHRFKPQLAICVYHSPVDFHRLARLVDSLEPGYRMALGHFTIHAEETVLFANHETHGLQDVAIDRAAL